MFTRSYSGPIASLVSASLLFGIVCGCGTDGMSTGASSSADNSVSSSSVFSDTSSSSPLPQSEATAFDESGAPGGTSPSSHTPGPVREVETYKEKEFVPRSGLQSGMLTAGSFDDVANYHEYVRLLQMNGHKVSQCQLPVSGQTQQTIIRLTDGQGGPIGDALVLVTGAGNDQNILLNLKTGSDGRTTLLTHSGYSSQQQPLRMKVFLPGREDAVIDELRTPQGEWNVILQDVQSTLPTQLDLALVIDTTGSMGDELDYLKAEIDSIAACVHRMFPNVDQRLSLITYRDQGDEYVCRTFDFTGSLSDFRKQLDSQSAGGGGDFPEAMEVALQNAVQLNWRPSNTARVMFLIGDAPPHREGAATAVTAMNELRQKGVRVFPIGASGVEKTAEVLMRTASVLTMGQYLFLTDHSGVGNAHATPSVSSFAVERLDRLMIRMIASELAGKRLIPQEVIAIERGESYSWAPPVACPQPACLPYRVPVINWQSCEVSEPSLWVQLSRWIRSNALATVIGAVSCAIVFNGLKRCRDI